MVGAALTSLFIGRARRVCSVIGMNTDPTGSSNVLADQFARVERSHAVVFDCPAQLR
jgi:hypothetical protein